MRPFRKIEPCLVLTRESVRGSEFSPANGCARGVERPGPAIILAVLSLISVFFVPSSLRAQPGGEWVGRRVVQKTADLRLRIGKHEHAPLNPAQAPRLYSVVEGDGDWLFLESSADSCAAGLSLNESYRSRRRSSSSRARFA